MRTVRVALTCMILLLLLPACEDDPILEPTPDDSGGGSYGNMAPLSTPRAADVRGSNPEIF